MRKEARVQGKGVLLFWYRNQIYAIESRSPAEGAYSEGFADAKLTQDFCIECPTTKTLFSLKTGEVVARELYADADEQPWLPYHDFSGGLRADGSLGRVSAAPAAGGLLWHRTSIVLRQSELRAFLTEALPVLVRNATWLAGKRAFVRAARDAYFSYEAATRQIYWFLRDPDSADIKCAQPPRSFYGGLANLGESWMQGVDPNTPA